MVQVMFWFAGLVGLALESKTVRKLMAASTIAALPPSASGEIIVEPPSYSASFNPFPALVIGVTGVAMSAHFQPYLFQVSFVIDDWGFHITATYLGLHVDSLHYVRFRYTCSGDISLPGALFCAVLPTFSSGCVLLRRYFPLALQQRHWLVSA